MKVYLLTDGAYSDYHVVSVCKTEELADKLADMRGYNVEEYECLDHEGEVVETATYWVDVDQEGNEVARGEVKYIKWFEEVPNLFSGKTPVWNKGKPAGLGFRGSSERGYDVALKIARDKLYEYKAEEAGLTTPKMWTGNPNDF